jgi:hypothetical protein
VLATSGPRRTCPGTGSATSLPGCGRAGP